MIVLDHLSKTYVGSAGAHEALRDINLHVEQAYRLLGDVQRFGSLGKAAAGDDSKETMDIRHIHKYHFSFLLILPSRKSLYKYLLEKSTNKFMLFFYVDV